MDRKILTGLSAVTYEHPFDRTALASLEKMPGVSLLLRKINEYGIDRLLRLQCLGSDIKVTPRNFPKLYDTFGETCQIIDVNPLPELYVFRGNGFIQSYTIGVEKPMVSINLEGMEWLDRDELIYLLAHELAHIKSQHLVYHQIAIVMPSLKQIINSTTLGLGGLAASGVELAFWNWLMMAKFTSDRAGLLACQDINVATTALMKIAGLPGEYLTDATIEDFLAQVKEFTDNNLDNLDKFTKMLSFMESRQSWAVMRAAELLKWVDSGDYSKLIEEDVHSESSTSVEDWDFLQSL
ncbi:MAG TPA: peptidase M48 [Cyanobacteria bacterium UBA11149]|nr:peptidase M48 [Cyanobacteria bacterium UBA11166]HBR75260.1 peptidase M48 [Cyanobacteria bacterium UBA11159]HBS71444.1 peptidase M48 [Cyanobacteria bacterium UBA11153]HBW91636.1 peptidase M48 [Cyanobacteria bacterium UBA11149]HCA95565.1 peptidase M48 [Cyanobacteria bacterium UBA9226]